VPYRTTRVFRGYWRGSGLQKNSLSIQPSRLPATERERGSRYIDDLVSYDAHLAWHKLRARCRSDTE
jgi:hypothetical protein